MNKNTPFLDTDYVAAEVMKFDKEDNVRTKMVRFIRENYANVLTREELDGLDTDEGLKRVHKKYCL